MRTPLPTRSRRAIVLLTLVMALVIVPAASALAASDYFLKIDGIEGESTAVHYEGQLDILSWSWGMSQSGNTAARGGGGAGKANFQDLSFAKQLDKASPKLMEAVVMGKHIPSAVLVLRNQGGDGPGNEYLKITMTDVLISSYSVSGGGDRPTEQVSLNFAKFVVDYFTPNADGTQGKVSFGWDLKKNVKV